MYIAVLVGICLLAITSLSLAETPPHAKQDFISIKQDALQRLQAELACVEAAQDDYALPACRPEPAHARLHQPDRSALPANGVESNQHNLPEM